MEFPFDVSKALPLDSNGFAILDAASPSTRTTTPSVNTYSRGMPLNYQASSKSNLMEIIDKMGEASTRAQGLGSIITSYSKFQCSGDQRLYIKVEENRVCGILKTGKKNLFYTDGFGGFKEIRPLCVLDFYVHESMQRKGVGKDLFEKMLAREGLEPHNLAYDRPSTKFTSFLKKYYGLSSYIPQNNNFVIFQQYFENTKKASAEQPIKKNTYETGSIQDYRDKKFNQNRADVAKPEKNTIIPNKTLTKPNQADQGYLSQQPAPKYLDRFDNTNNIYSNAPKPSKQQYTYQEVEAQMNAADEVFEKQKAKDSSNTAKGKTQIWNVSSDKPQVGFSTKAPWGSYGANMDSFKSSSSAYGSYYTSNRSNSRNK